MSFSDKNGGNLSEDSLTITTSDLEHFAQLSNEIEFTTVEMDTQEESDKNDSTQEEKEDTTTEIESHEVEIVTDRGNTPDEILPDLRKAVVPPLRPLTIAPKPPAGSKVPISLKPAAISGQQFILVQGGSPGQAIKFLSPQGQSISLANLGKPVTIKPAVKAVSVSAAQAAGLSVVQPKQIVMRKIATATQGQKITSVVETKPTGILVAQKADGTQVLKAGTNLISSPSKTITLAQAQQLGLLAGAKIVTQPVTKQAVFVNKAQNKPVKIMPQGSKYPAKILPAPQGGTSKGPQKIIVKQATGTTLLANQIIQVAGAQGLATGQLHPINIPGKGIQYIKFVTASSANETSTSSTTVTSSKASPSSSTGGKLIAITPGNTVLQKNISGTTNIAPKTAKVLTSSVRASEVTQTSSAPTQLLMLPSSYIRAPAAKVPIPAKPAAPKAVSSSEPSPVTSTQTTSVATSPIIEPAITLETNGMRPRKPCNCTKSQCLKLYCDCFANGEFCFLCNCMNCFNNLNNEEHRQLAIKSCLERNPNAFRPKIGKARDTGSDTQVRKHTKGCNCKRSGCLKNYCECYEAKIACSSNCKCFGCRNIESSLEKKGIQLPASPVNVPHNVPQITPNANPPRNLLQMRSRRHSSSKQAFSLITDDVIEITAQCLLAISDSGESDLKDEESIKEQIIIEFGRCLQEIISHSTTRPVSSTNSSSSKLNAPV